MKAYYITDAEICRAHAGAFSHCHWIDLPNGQALVAAVFSKPEHQDTWESHPSVESLPSLYDPVTEVSDEHVEKLRHLGIKKGDKTKHVVAVARRIHALL